LILIMLSFDSPPKQAGSDDDQNAADDRPLSLPVMELPGEH